MTAYPEPSRGLISGSLHRYAVRVYYEDTDAGGIVYHANYLRWFERARSDMLDLLGIDQRGALEAGEGGYVVADMGLAFRAPARLGDAVMVESRLERVMRAGLQMRQVALRDGKVLCEATVKVGFIGPDGKPQRQPEHWREAFLAFLPEEEG